MGRCKSLNYILHFGGGEVRVGVGRDAGRGCGGGVYGGRYPFVLREVGGGGGEKRYRIVGDCYLHGGMEGEAVEEGSGCLEMEFVLV